MTHESQQYAHIRINCLNVAEYMSNVIWAAKGISSGLLQL